VAYWSALHYWNMTEQVSHTVFVQSTRRKRPVEVLGIRFRFVTVSQARFFGVARRTQDGKPIYVTEREKTLLDAAARLDLSGGVEQLAQALCAAWTDLEWAKFEDYLTRWGGGVVVKRLGYLVEALSLPIPDFDRRLERWQGLLSHGVSLLEPGAPADGPVITRWRIRANVAITAPGRSAR
jgi:predicted transcriptional regulator of viral defense system